MKVVVLGAGGMGGYAARTASTLGFIDELIVADLDATAASATAAACGAAARGTTVDVCDPSDLARLLAPADAVLNTVGPFFRLGPPVLRAAIETGTHYLDINDDWESTEAMLAMDADARAAGITAVIGMGASPGMSNLMAVLAMRELDEVEEVLAGFDLDAAMPETRGAKPAAATVHGLHQLTGTIRVFENGAFRDARPMQTVHIDYPGLGPRTGWTMGHPEAITFPRSRPGLHASRVVMTMSAGNRLAVRVIAALIDAGLLSLERAAVLVERIEGVGKPVKTPDDYVREIVDSRARRLPPLFAVARGRRGGAAASVAVTILAAPPVGMGGATGVPLATALGVVRPDGDAPRGVLAPEAAVDPERFFDALSPLCEPACASGRDVVVVTRSWEATDMAEEIARRHGRP